MDDELRQLTTKKQRLDTFRPLPPELIKNLDEWFRVELTYTSNAIEGNTLTRAETALIVEKGLTVQGKSLTEHLEATNHAEALDYVKTLVGKKRQDITENDILEIHRLILNKIEAGSAGRYEHSSTAYRTQHARLTESDVVLPNPIKVPDLMEEFIIATQKTLRSYRGDECVKRLQSSEGNEQNNHRFSAALVNLKTKPRTFSPRKFIRWLVADNPNHIVKIGADAHYKLVSIHPFSDGNGRTSRLLMNLLLMQRGYPPAIIRKEDRLAYINSLEKAQKGGSLDDFYNLIYEAVDRSLDIYLEAIEPERISAAEPSPGQRFYTTEEVAKLLQVDPESVRRYVRSGKLRAVRLGGKFIRIDRADLNSFIEGLKS